jgi:outer membrane protein OmpA-like peptidoglycan-associated protein
VPDHHDSCPQASGGADLGGCPDRDGDRVTDEQDRCPDVAGLRVLNGCPDRDRDGLADHEDRCPDQPGVASLGGCLPDAVGKFVGVVKGIQFDSASDQLLPGSLPLLDELAALLVEFPQLHLHIDGHTDTSGDPQSNHRLSHARAAAVKAYLMRKGVAARRLEAEGWGDQRPIADNATEDGRARNRRIELTVVGGE